MIRDSARRRRWDRLLWALGLGATILVFLLPVVLLADLLVDGAAFLSLNFFTSFASRFPDLAGIRAPLMGTLWILALTAMISLPVSVGAAVYLEEYASRSWWTRAIGANIASLAGVPSVVYGILGLALFVRALNLGESVLAGALTLSLLVMPMIIIGAQEAIRTIPPGIREAAYGLGATRWQVVRHQVLPLALPGILSGTLFALVRAVGETAPILMIGVLAHIGFSPEGIDEPFTVLPVQIFNWITRGEEFHGLAAGGIIVLLGILISMSTLAVIIRRRYATPVRD